MLGGICLDIAEWATMMRTPELQNTDGEPLEPHTLVFDVKDRAAVESAFDSATLEGGETLSSDDPVTAHAGVPEARWTWSRAGGMRQPGPEVDPAIPAMLRRELGLD